MRLVYSTNENILRDFKGVEVEEREEGGGRSSFVANNGNYFRTSNIRRHEFIKDGAGISIRTENSTYIFAL